MLKIQTCIIQVNYFHQMPDVDDIFNLLFFFEISSELIDYDSRGFAV